jgi:oligoribonuclease
MKTRYLAIDLETTGLDPETCQILELAAVVETDWGTPVEELPTLRLLVSHDVYRGEPFALAMHADIFRAHCRPWADRERDTIDGKFLAAKLASFAWGHGLGTPTLAGKNLGTFDLRFLERLPGWKSFRHRRRIIDPGVLWFDPATDEQLPDTPECLRRAGITNDRPHSAVHDCRAVIELVRAAYRRQAVPRAAA